MDIQDLVLHTQTLDPPPSTIRKKYTENAVQKSIAAVTTKSMTLGQASSCFGVPKSTIKFRLGSKWTKKLRRGPQTVLTLQEETNLIKRIQEMERRGFPCTKYAVVSRVKAFLDKNPRKTPFKDNKPGQKWLQLLLGRHKQLSIRKPESVTMAGATVSESDIRAWFQKIRQYLQEHSLDDILTDPRRILNGDETMFLFDPVTKAVVASKGNRNVYLVQQADSKKNVTVLFTFDADGYMFPPDAILPYKRLSKSLILSFDPEWGVGKSDRGWMDSENFMAYIQNVLHPSLVCRNVPFPVIYFVDGHSSHTGYDAAELCANLGIILIALYPNATHIMQPADVAIFKPLKNSWGKCVNDWRMRNDGRVFTIEDFPGVLKEAINQGISPAIVRSGFRKCGLYPYDADAVDYTRCLASSTQDDSISCTATSADETVPVDLKKIKEALSMVGTTRIKSFEGDENGVLDDSEKALLYIYKSILSEYDVDNIKNNTVWDENDEQAQSSRRVALSSARNDMALEPEDVEVNGATEHISELITPTADVSIETVDNWSTLQASVVPYEVEQSLQYSYTEQNDLNVTIVNRVEPSEPLPKPQRGVLKEIVNNEKHDRRTSISTFFNLPPTPKRKNVQRNYKSKRHFVLTSSERLKELEEKDAEKQRVALEKEAKIKERAMKKELKEKEKQERLKIKEQKRKEREAERHLKVQSKKIASKTARKRMKFADENA